MPMMQATPMLSRRHNWLVAVCLMMPLSAVGGSADGPANVAYRTSASEVRVTFFTTDAGNHPVEAVSKDDFAIVDGDMVVRDFRSLARSSETELDVVILVDASGSIGPRLQPVVNDVLQLFSQKPMASDQNIAVMSFAGLQPSFLCSGDCRSAAANQRLSALRPAGATPLFDALAAAAAFFFRRQRPEVRPVLILFSDGDDTISRTSAEDALQALIASGTLLYAVDLNAAGSVTSGTRTKTGNASRGSATLQQLAEATGGRCLFMQDDASHALQSALEDLHASYVVTYNLPSRAPGFHTLRILPKHDLNMRFHCRAGYYYENETPAPSL